MNMGLTEGLLITLLNTIVCLCLPKAISLIGSSVNRQSLELRGDRTTSSHPDLSQPEAYSELTTAALK